MSAGITRTNTEQVAGNETPQNFIKNLGSALGIASPSLSGGKRSKKSKKAGKKSKKAGKKTKKAGKKSRKSRK